MYKIVPIILAFFIILLPSCNSCNDSSTKPQENKSTTKTTQTEDRKVLYAFIDPNGGPCIQQVKILNNMAKKISEYANVVFVKTTEPFDRQSFYDYGIRSLPNLVFVDEKGNALHRFPPGIQSESAIMELFRGK